MKRSRKDIVTGRYRQKAGKVTVAEAVTGAKAGSGAGKGAGAGYQTE